MPCIMAQIGHLHGLTSPARRGLMILICTAAIMPRASATAMINLCGWNPQTCAVIVCVFRAIGLEFT